MKICKNKLTYVYHHIDEKENIFTWHMKDLEKYTKLFKNKKTINLFKI